MRSPSRLYFLGWLCLAGLLIAGCTKNAEPNTTAYPKPGEMRVVSVTPVSPSQSANLIPSGAFEEWYAGADQPSCSAILAPLKTSKIDRVSGDAVTGQISIRQLWDAADNPWRPEDLFGVCVWGLKPGSRYELRVQAKANKGSSAVVEVYGVRGNEPLWHIALKDWMAIKSGEGWQEYSAEFDSGEFTEVQVKTGFFGKYDKSIPNSVLWDGWTLHRIAESPAPTIAMNGLISNGGFHAWIPGKPAPESFTAPDADLNHSQVFPMKRTDRDNDGASVQQNWTEGDDKDAPQTLFGTEVSVKPNTKYTFGCKGQDRGFKFAVGVYGINEKGEFAAIKDPFFTFEGKNEWAQPEAVFESGPYSKIRIVTHTLPEAGKFPFYVIFDAWTLKEG